MFGISLVIIATAFEEFAESSNKRWIGKSVERLYSFALLSVIWGALLFSVLYVIKGGHIDVRSLPFLALRLVFEVLQMHLTVTAIAIADRSTYGFLRILTIPLLLGVDIFLGYDISLFQIFGITLIAIALLFLFANHGLTRKGMWFVLGSAVNAVITTSLYQYDIKHFNTLEAEQMLIFVALVLYFMMVLGLRFPGSLKRFFTDSFLTKRSVAQGLGPVVMSYAYLFAPASVVIAGKRACAVLASLISGNIVFHEKHFYLKLFSASLIIASIVLLSLGH